MTARSPAGSHLGPADARLSGSPAAQRLLREVAADPGRARCVGVVGPGGFGKTLLLDALADAYRDAGFTVLRTAPPPDVAPDPDVALLIDDAHLLPDADLERLAAVRPAARLVVAHRPWPRRAALAVLAAHLAADHPPVVLDVLDRTGIAARAALRGERPAPQVLDRVAEWSRGVPVLVDRMLAAIDADAAEPPAGVLAQLGCVLGAADPGVCELLLARALGAAGDAEVLGPLLGLPGSDAAAAVDDLTERAWAAGLLAPGGEPVPLVSAAVLARTPAARRLELRRAVAELELARGGDVLGAARGLLGTGASGSRVATVFTAGADEALRVGSASAGELYDAAVVAGAPALELAARRAEAALLGDDPDTALAQADQVLSAADRLPASDAVRAGTVAAAVLARRGMLGRSAKLYRWLDGLGSPSVLAVPALIGTGALAEAREVLRAPAPTADCGRPPTLLAGAEELLARGVHDSVTGSPTAALSQLTRAAALLEQSPRAALLPDTPAALAALVAVHCGELDVAQSVLERAVRVDLGGPGAAVRHRLLLGWIALFRGAIGVARGSLASTASQGTRLEPRDELLAAALEVALARRAGDLGSLMPAWGRAREAIVRHPVDLFALQQLGELSIAATRLRETSWVRPHLDEASALLARLDDPALWAAPLHWAGLMSAILVEDRGSARDHAAALGAASGGSRYAAAMAMAAPHWVRLLDADVDADAVEAAARGLHAVGLSWEGGKLAGQAAIRTRDRRAMTTLLGCARALQASAGPPREPAEAEPQTADVPEPPVEEPGDGALSDREREVAALVLEGLTYRQIGERLFISAKTVEHHVARMRQRLGSGSRGELFAHLRQIVG